MLENRIFVGDSASISASLEDETGEPTLLISATWEFLRPDGSPLIVDTLPSGVPSGSVYVLSSAYGDFSAWTTVQWDGKQWNSITGTYNVMNETQTEAILVIPGAAISQDGLYKGRAKFTLSDGQIRSSLVNFEAYDPFETSMPVELPVSQYFTNQFITTVLSISDSQAFVSGIDVGASVGLNAPGINVVVPDPGSTESPSFSTVSTSSDFESGDYEYLIAYRVAIGTDGNYIEGYAGIPNIVTLDDTLSTQIIFDTDLDSSLSRVIYRRSSGSPDWFVVIVLDNTAQTFVDEGFYAGSYPPSAWYGSSDLNITFYAEKSGLYRVGTVAQFTVDGPQGRTFTAQRSISTSTQVFDPAIIFSPANTVPIRIIDHSWMKLEDLFDSELGGPWLTDETIKTFNKDKLALLLPDAIYRINNEFQPITTFNEENWPEEHIPLAAQSLMVEGIYHLIRSYVEQPLPSGGQLNWYDRRDYITRWQSVLTKEEEKLMHLADKFKLQFTGFGSTSMIVGGYATPITRLSKFWRTRYPRYIGPWGF